MLYKKIIGDYPIICIVGTNIAYIKNLIVKIKIEYDECYIFNTNGLDFVDVSAINSICKYNRENNISTIITLDAASSLDKIDAELTCCIFCPVQTVHNLRKIAGLIKNIGYDTLSKFLCGDAILFKDDANIYQIAYNNFYKLLPQQ